MSPRSRSRSSGFDGLPLSGSLEGTGLTAEVARDHIAVGVCGLSVDSGVTTISARSSRTNNSRSMPITPIRVKEQDGEHTKSRARATPMQGHPGSTPPVGRELSHPAGVCDRRGKEALSAECSTTRLWRGPQADGPPAGYAGRSKRVKSVGIQTMGSHSRRASSSRIAMIASAYLSPRCRCLSG